jgi:class 3 adenylate cyclase
MVEELRKKQRYRETLGRYVSEDVASRLLEEETDLDLDGEDRHVTILFIDIRGFTALARALSPRALVALLNEYFGMIIEVIFAYEGTINKFIGDSVMAVFGAPMSVADAEYKAVRAGTEIQRVVEARNEDRRELGELEVALGIGINSGQAVAGNIGSARRLEYTVVGDAVNLAQRIESISKRGQVLISATTYGAVRDRVEVADLGPTALRGFADPVRIYQVTQVLG